MNPSYFGHPIKDIMLFTILGGLVGFAIGCYRTKNSNRDVVSFLFDFVGVGFWTVGGACLGFGLGVGLLAGHKHPLQNI